MATERTLLEDYLIRWGKAQKCTSCGFVLAFGEYSRKQKCCGMVMQVVEK